MNGNVAPNTPWFAMQRFNRVGCPGHKRVQALHGSVKMGSAQTQDVGRQGHVGRL